MMNEKYGRPYIEIMNTEAQNKTLRLRESVNSGSGVYLRIDRLFKIIDSSFVEVLMFPQEGHFSLGIGINQSVSGTISTGDYGNDTLIVGIDYEFFPNYYDNDTLFIPCGEGSETHILVSDTTVTVLHFDPKEKRYVGNFEKNRLNSKKLKR